MKFICSKEDLLKSINIVSKAVSNRTTIPILECILIKVDEIGFKLLANDLELGIESSYTTCDILEKGEICLNAKMLLEIVRHLPNEEVLIESNENLVTLIKSGKSEFKILGQSSEDFPSLPFVEKSNRYEIFSTDLRNMIRETIFSVSIDESKMVLTGLLLDIQNNYINIVAVDGFRISLRKEKLIYSAQNNSTIIPSKTMSEVSKILPTKADDKISIYITDKHVLFEMEDCIVVSRVIEGEFMNYEQVFTDDYTTRIILDRNKFVNSLERSSIISDIKKNPVKLQICMEEMDTVVITSNNELGTTYDEIHADMDGNPLEIDFNPKYLIDSLKAIKDEKISIQFTTPLSPCIIKSLDSEDYKYLILPLRLRN